MASRMTLRSKVLPVNRVEFTAPDLPEGADVEIVVRIAAPSGTRRRSVLELIDARPPSRLTADDWRRIEQQIQDDRDSWDR